jgi:hypothetical protein
MAISQELYETIVTVVDDRLRDVKVTRQAFDDLREAIFEAQERADKRFAQAEERLSRVEAAIERLTERQAQAEERLSRVEAAIERLTENQTRIEAAIERLTERQDRTEAAIERLTEAQARTEVALKQLAEAQARTDRRVAQLGETIGFGLEDIVKVTLPGYLERHLGIHLKGRLGEELRRKFIGPPGREVEIDLYGEGQQDGRAVTVVVEVKTRVRPSDVGRFAKQLERIRKTLISGDLIPVLFGHVVYPASHTPAQERNIFLVAAHQR